MKIKSVELKEPLGCYFCEDICIQGICDICSKIKKCIVDYADPYDVEINESEDPDSFLYCQSCFEERKSQI